MRQKMGKWMLLLQEEKEREKEGLKTIATP